MLGARRMMQSARCAVTAFGRCASSAADSDCADQAGKRHHAEAAADAAERFAAGDGRAAIDVTYQFTNRNSFELSSTLT